MPSSSEWLALAEAAYEAGRFEAASAAALIAKAKESPADAFRALGPDMAEMAARMGVPLPKSFPLPVRVDAGVVPDPADVSADLDAEAVVPFECGFCGFVCARVGHGHMRCEGDGEHFSEGCVRPGGA